MTTLKNCKLRLMVVHLKFGEDVFEFLLDQESHQVPDFEILSANTDAASLSAGMDEVTLNFTFPGMKIYPGMRVANGERPVTLAELRENDLIATTTLSISMGYNAKRNQITFNQARCSNTEILCYGRDPSDEVKAKLAEVIDAGTLVECELRKTEIHRPT